MVWRVYPDGRPDELVRGVDIVGTPLVALNNILVTGDKLEIFNGICGAESGQVPNTRLCTPAMLFSQAPKFRNAPAARSPPDSAGSGHKPDPENSAGSGSRTMNAMRKTALDSRGCRPSPFLFSAWLWAAPLLLLAGAATAAGQQGSGAASSPSVSAAAAASADPVLQAMSEEINRSRTRLKMDNLPAPYYIEFRVSDVDDFTAEASFGALRLNQRVHSRTLRAVVRVGDYKQDSYAGPGMGSRRSRAAR